MGSSAELDLTGPGVHHMEFPAERGPGLTVRTWAGSRIEEHRRTGSEMSRHVRTVAAVAW